MDMTDIEKEIASLKLPQTKPGKRVDLSVKHAHLKIIISKAMALLFFLAVALFAMYTIVRANDLNVDSRIVTVAGLVYVALGAYVALKLWNLEFVGWLVMFYVSLAGIGLPAISAYSRALWQGQFRS